MTYPNVWVSIEQTEMILDLTPNYTVRLSKSGPKALRRAARNVLTDAVTDEEITAQQRLRALAAIQERFAARS